MPKPGYRLANASENGSARPIQPGQPTLKKSSNNAWPSTVSRSGAASPKRVVACQGVIRSFEQ